MRKILCCGGRDYSDASAVHYTLSRLPGMFPEGIAIIHGGARGADSLCGAWARDNGVPEIVMAAQWDKYGKQAGSMRNQWMFEILQPTYAVAFPGGVGTEHMVRILERANVPVWRPYG